MTAQIGHNSAHATCPTCGGPLSHRSDKDHRMFRAIVRRAYDNWPSEHPFQPDSEDCLYGWLLIEANHRTCVDVETADKQVALGVAQAIFQITEREIHWMRVFDTATGVRICVPKSLSYESAGGRVFHEVRSAVYEIIEMTLGVSVESLKRARSA